jgi:hypothetical protein
MGRLTSVPAMAFSLVIVLRIMRVVRTRPRGRRFQISRFTSRFREINNDILIRLIRQSVPTHHIKTPITWHAVTTKRS